MHGALDQEKESVGGISRDLPEPALSLHPGFARKLKRKLKKVQSFLLVFLWWLSFCVRRKAEAPKA
jgi:hypothetical protein